MKKMTFFLTSSLVVLGLTFSLIPIKIFAYDSNDNMEIAKNILLEDGYSVSKAEDELKTMTVQSEGELVAIDICSSSERNAAQFKALPKTSVQYLSHSAVKQIYSNFNAIDNGSYILGTLIGIKNPILGAIISAGGFQNPNLRKAITKAYYQGKRVKIVTEYGASMSLNKTYYYVVD